MIEAAEGLDLGRRVQHEDTRTLLRLDQAVGAKSSDGFAHHRSADPVGFGQLRFARQLAARGELAGGDGAAQCVAETGHQGLRLCFGL